ncbi:Mur ligase [Crucibulum laeve]|uniref:Mur ligase n=1 Tax=Crucibulum laeve TaxID=68775 RepID=A0A5C3M1W6_9AGAR|nr:Mur ligase [Crucibulum laeve]
MSIDLSLDRIQRLTTHLPPYTRPTIHIAGTNGKGSVAALVSSILLASKPPYSVGRYTSPHLVSVYDSICIDNEPVSLEVYALLRDEVERADREHSTHLSSFELLTLTVLRIFEHLKLDIVVLEVGMGGRLDATNIIPDSCVLVSALTTVDLDHQAFLGDTISEIAREKAGIARSGKPLVLGRQVHDEVEGVVKRVLEDVGGTLVKAVDVHLSDLPDETLWEDRFSFNPKAFQEPPAQRVRAELPCFHDPSLKGLLYLYGAHQLDNLGTALGIISALLTSSPSSLDFQKRITMRSIENGIMQTRWPGRLSFHQYSVPGTPTPLAILADGAHNPASAATLGTYITSLLNFVLPRSHLTPSPPLSVTITYILALSHSPPKTPLQTLSPVLPPVIPISEPAIPNRIEVPLELTVNVNVALPTFTLPEGMPWVKCVPPAELAGVVGQLVPDANVWVPSEHTEGVDAGKGDLERSLEWAAVRVKDNATQHLVVIAGSLYLVADFYRLLGQKKDEKAVDT